MRRDAGGEDASSPLSQIWQPLKHFTTGPSLLWGSQIKEAASFPAINNFLFYVSLCFCFSRED